MEQILTAKAAVHGKLRIAIGIVLFAILGLAAIWAFLPSPPPVDLDLSRSKASAKGLYQVAVEPEAGTFKMGELHNWLITVKSKDGAPVEDARIAVDGGMPQHHHGLPTAPAVTASLGGGKYRVEGVKFHMSGWWELKFAIASPAGEDQAVFNIVIE